MMIRRATLILLTAAALAVFLTGCTHRYARTVADFQHARDAGDIAQARALMSDDPRKWWGPRESEGTPWRLDAGAGRWGAWDRHFRSESIPGPWAFGDGWARRTHTEINDYYRLTQRGPQRNVQTWWFDDRGRIEGWSIEGIRDEDSYGRTDEFLAWARRHHPEELDYLRPGGDIDPTGDRPERTRALLNLWRREAGLEPIP